MSKLFLVRHAEPEQRGVLLGRMDPALSHYGREQARKLASALPNYEAVYASPLRRALETAAILAAEKVKVIPGLAEIGLGEWDGLSWAEIERRDPDLAKRKLEDWLGVTPPGGEHWADFSSRVHSALDQIRLGPHPAVIIAHITVNSEIAHQLDGSEPVNFQQDYCQIRTYAFPTHR